MTRYLLDTHIIYRWMRDDRRIGREMRRILAQSDCAVSVASVWEMVIKNSLGKLPLPAGSIADAINTQGFRVLSIAAQHVEATRRFDQVVADPFDRLLLATAAEEGLMLLTQDSNILELASRSSLPVATVGR